MILDWEHQVTGPGYTGISQGISGSEIRAKVQSDDPVGALGIKWSSSVTLAIFGHFSL
jgi:hypothetical protein